MWTVAAPVVWPVLAAIIVNNVALLTKIGLSRESQSALLPGKRAKRLTTSSGHGVPTVQNPSTDGVP